MQLRDEQHFECGTWNLGHLVSESKDALPWQDHLGIQTAVSARKKLAHRGVTLKRCECWKHIDAIKRELAAWGIVGGDSSRGP